MRGLSLLLFITLAHDAATDLYVTGASLPELGVSAAPPATSPVAARYIPRDYGHPGIALARSAEEPTAPSTEDGESPHHHGGGYKIVQWEWSYVQTPYIIASWLLVASVAKIRKFCNTFCMLCFPAYIVQRKKVSRLFWLITRTVWKVIRIEVVNVCSSVY